MRWKDDASSSHDDDWVKCTMRNEVVEMRRKDHIRKGEEGRKWEINGGRIFRTFPLLWCLLLLTRVTSCWITNNTWLHFYSCDVSQDTSWMNKVQLLLFCIIIINDNDHDTFLASWCLLQKRTDSCQNLMRWIPPSPAPNSSTRKQRSGESDEERVQKNQRKKRIKGSSPIGLIPLIIWTQQHHTSCLQSIFR